MWTFYINGGSCGPFISMGPNTIYNIKKDIFLTNLENKRNFMKSLRGTLHDSGCHILYSDDDADRLTVETAIKLNHVIKGCDTTSHLHSIKRKLPLTLLSTSDTFLKAAAEFKDNDNSKDNIVHDIEIYSPTSCAQHSLRVYHQIMEWKVYTLNPLEWGFTMRNNTMMPIMTTAPIAPELLFINLHGKCTTGCKNMRCTCRKLGLPCSYGCISCKDSCTNVQ